MTIRDRKELLWILVASALILTWGPSPTRLGYQAETIDHLCNGEN